MNQKLKKIKEVRKQINDLTAQLECSLIIQKLFPNAQWPVFTSIFQHNDTREFLFRIRDSNHSIKTLTIKETPVILLQRPHIQKACETNPTLNQIINKGRTFEEIRNGG